MMRLYQIWSCLLWSVEASRLQQANEVTMSGNDILQCRDFGEPDGDLVNYALSFFNTGCPTGWTSSSTVLGKASSGCNFNWNLGCSVEGFGAAKRDRTFATMKDGDFNMNKGD
eukprot:s167_g35.t1